MQVASRVVIEACLGACRSLCIVKLMYPRNVLYLNLAALSTAFSGLVVLEGEKASSRMSYTMLLVLTVKVAVRVHC